MDRTAESSTLASPLEIQNNPEWTPTNVLNRYFVDVDGRIVPVAPPPVFN
jgi:hypothetical protein